jgi:bacterioferritin (cytochrome b1)
MQDKLVMIKTYDEADYTIETFTFHDDAVLTDVFQTIQQDSEEHCASYTQILGVECNGYFSLGMEENVNLSKCYLLKFTLITFNFLWYM